MVIFVFGASKLDAGTRSGIPSNGISSVGNFCDFPSNELLNLIFSAPSSGVSISFDANIFGLLKCRLCKNKKGDGIW